MLLDECGKHFHTHPIIPTIKILDTGLEAVN